MPKLIPEEIKWEVVGQPLEEKGVDYSKEIGG